MQPIFSALLHDDQCASVTVGEGARFRIPKLIDLASLLRLTLNSLPAPRRSWLLVSSLSY